MSVNVEHIQFVRNWSTHYRISTCCSPQDSSCDPSDSDGKTVRCRYLYFSRRVTLFRLFAHLTYRHCSYDSHNEVPFNNSQRGIYFISFIINFMQLINFPSIGMNRNNITNMQLQSCFLTNAKWHHFISLTGFVTLPYTSFVLLKLITASIVFTKNEIAHLPASLTVRLFISVIKLNPFTHLSFILFCLCICSLKRFIDWLTIFWTTLQLVIKGQYTTSAVLD